MMRCILVAGPRSSGTKLLTRILVDSGAFGDADHTQRMDVFDDQFHELSSEGSKLVPTDILDAAASFPVAVIRRSVPHGCGWPNFALLKASLAKYGFDLTDGFWMVRDVWANVQSQVKTGHELTLQTAFESIRQVQSMMFPRSVPINYDKLGDIHFVQKTFDLLGLGLVANVSSFASQDEKHYDSPVS